MKNNEQDNQNIAQNYAFSCIKGNLKKWKFISAILFIILIFFGFKIFKSNVKTNENNIENIKKNFIAKIQIDHPIIQSEDFSVSSIIETLKKLEKKQELKGLLLEINSPGGGVLNSFELYDAINLFREKTGKPVCALIKDFGTSGAYLTSIAADYIFANNVSIVGSIGVLMQIVDLTEFGEKIGIKMKTYRSGPLKALPNPFEKTISKSEPDLMMNEIIDDLKEQFFSAVKSRRAMISKENFFEIEKAGVFIGKRAKEIGLIDGIGGENEISEWFKNKNLGENFEIILVQTQFKKNNLMSNILKGEASFLSSNFFDSIGLKNIFFLR
jgi:protease-4